MVVLVASPLATGWAQVAPHPCALHRSGALHTPFFQAAADPRSDSVDITAIEVSVEELNFAANPIRANAAVAFRTRKRCQNPSP
jgi:hypothetical protein